MNAVLFWSVVITVIAIVFFIIFLILTYFKIKDNRSSRHTEYRDERVRDTTTRRVEHRDETDFNPEVNVPNAIRQNTYNPYPRGATSSSEQSTFPILSSENRRNSYSTNGSTSQSFSPPYPTSPRHPLPPHSTGSPPYPIQPLHPLPHDTVQMPSEAATYPIHDDIRPRTRLHIDLEDLLPQSNFSGAASCSTSPPSYAEAMAAEDAAREYKRTAFRKSSR